MTPEQARDVLAKEHGIDVKLNTVYKFLRERRLDAKKTRRTSGQGNIWQYTVTEAAIRRFAKSYRRPAPTV